MQNSDGSGKCTYKTDNNGMTFTTTSPSSVLQSTRVAGMQKAVYMRSEYVAVFGFQTLTKGSFLSNNDDDYIHNNNNHNISRRLHRNTHAHFRDI